MKNLHPKKNKSSYTILEQLPWYAILILGTSLFILFMTIGFAVGILWNKDKIESLKNQLTMQQKEEERKIESIIKSYQKKFINSPNVATPSLKP